MKLLSGMLVMLMMAVSFVTASVGSQETEESGLIKVSAERLEADEATRSVTFYGKVMARQSGMVVYADKMTLFYQEGASRDIDRVEISGSLRIVQADRVATADRGIFLSQKGQVLLSGNAKVHQSGNSIVGDEIIYYLNESRSVVKSQPDSRVNAVFRAGSEK